jgi:hypothetical protein
VSHFSVVVCIDDPAKLDATLAPFDENLEVEPYRDYEKGAPAKFWAVDSLRKHEGLNPDDATLTWAEVADAHNRRYAPSYVEAGLLRPEQESPLLVDDSGRAYSMSTRNPQAKWDWWSVGGQWAGYFVAGKGARARVLKPQRNHRSADVIDADRCDGGQKRDLDLEALRERKARDEMKRLAEWRTVTEGTPKALSWASFRDQVSDETGYTIDRAREEYHSQPRVQAIRQTDFSWDDDPIAEYDGQPSALLIEKAKARAVPGYAVIALDGHWIAPGEMGWFGMSTETESEQIGYWEAANAYIESLPGDAYLIVVDCHI